MRVAAAGAALVSSIALGACSERATENPVLSEIALNVPTLTPAIADTLRATAVGLDQEGRSMPVGDVVWSATGVATVTQSGLIVGTALGTAIIRVTVVGRPMYAEVRLTIGPKPAVGVNGGGGIVVARNVPFNLGAAAVNADGIYVRKTGIPITLTLSGGGTLSGTRTATTDAAGSASFPGLTIDGPSGVKTLTWSSPGLTSGTSKITLISGVANKIELISGGNQEVGRGFSTSPLIFRVTDADGYPVENVPVSFTITSGTGSLAVQSATTGYDGIASSGPWYIGALGTHTMRASVQGVSVAANATATGVRFLSAITISRSAVSVAVGQTIQATVSGVDDSGAPYLPPNATIEWYGDGQTIATSDGAVTGVREGNSTLSANVNGRRTSVIVPVTGSASRALRMVAFPTVVTHEAALTTDPVVQLVDAASQQPITEAGHVVTATSYGPLLTPDRSALGLNVINGTLTAVTDGSGVARFPGLSMLARSNQFGMTFRTPGSIPVTSPIVFILPGAPAAFVIIEGNNQSAIAGNTVAINPIVRVENNAGNWAANVPVTFTVTSGGGTLTSVSTMTDPNGRATVGSWRLGTAGVNTLTVTSPAFSGSAVFTATARPF